MENFSTNTISQSSKSMLRILTLGDLGVGKSTLQMRLLAEISIGSEANIEKRASEKSDLKNEYKSEKTLDISSKKLSLGDKNLQFVDNIQEFHRAIYSNMAASITDLALLMVDASKGILPPTKRQIYIASLLGIRNVVLIVNNIDLVDQQQEVFEAIQRELEKYAEMLGNGESPFKLLTIPISALQGDNVTSSENNLPWYNGDSILTTLESIQEECSGEQEPLRMLLESPDMGEATDHVCRGQLFSGSICEGDQIKVFPGAVKRTVEQIFVGGELTNFASTGQLAELHLSQEVRFSSNGVVSSAENPCEVANQFDTTIIWMSDDPMLPGRTYLIKCGNQSTRATITGLKYKVNVVSLAQEPLTKLEVNEIGECNIAVDSQLAFDRYKINRAIGSFMLIDRLSEKPVGMGLIRFALRRASNIHWQFLDVDKKSRSIQKKQKPAVLWFTGLSGSGKSTIANILERKLAAAGKHTYCLDGDNVRHGLNKDLGFTDADRVENIRRITEVSKLMLDAGLITLVSFISPFRSERRMARNSMKEGEFLEIYVDTPLDVAEQRDVKGLYKKARAGQIKNFTGIDSAYEAPQNPEIQLNTVDISAEKAAELIIKELEARDIV